ncbi:amino acid adenylation domain-containing protein [Streptomyces griseochromogenes]|uniref:Amino acid adenylation domain-containing protein n=2 Tax=Streptomyces griseochromogenes TaxID=68214 RepID=A0A1B1ATM7_9ACTN|nr:hypothetical protein AVL59_10165 [Streptomyces griseochromogenes]MBP2048491.1 amino acid adenylation domain-containing protein [Streptomyces griseochromogenes]
MLESLAPGTPVNNQSVAFAVAGQLDPAELERALSVLLRRHEALRTVYRGDGTRLVKRVVGPDEFELDIAQVVLPQEPTEDDLASVTAAPFDLNGRPMLRVALFRGPGRDVFCVTAHHLIFDGLSSAVFLEEFAAAYGHVVEGQPVLGTVQAAPSGQSLAFWKKELAGASVDDLELACAAPEPDRPTLAGAQISRSLSPRIVAAVRRLGGELRVPDSAILLAAYYALLEGHGAGPDLVVGSPVDVRPEHAARAIGYHVNYVPLRMRVDQEERVRDLVLRSNETLLTATAHADVPVDAHADLMPRSRSGRRATPFRYVFQYRTGDDLAEFRIGSLVARPFLPGNGFSKFDVDFSAAVTDESIEVRARYRTELFESSDAELLLVRYEAVLSSFADDADGRIGDVRMWSARDREVIGEANDTARPVEPASVLRGIQDRVRETPDAVAVVDGEQLVSYRRLWNAAHGICELIHGAGLGTGDVVAVALPRGAELAAAVIGTWLAGAAYLPIDSAHPEERIRYQLSDSAAKVLLATEDMAHFADGELTVLTVPTAADAPDSDLVGTRPVVVDPAACAYLIYTSGSTGRPKGTLVSHSALANLTAHFVEELGAAATDTMLWLTTFAFDISGLELFVPLVSGGRLVPAPDPARSDGRVLRELVERHQVRFIQATPTTWRLVIDRVEGCLGGRSVLAGGEPVPAWLAQRLVAAGSEFHHVYGPTETTIWSTSRVVSDESEARLDVGRPIRNTQVLVLDQYGRELPIGVRGELCIAGAGVAIGYHDRPELNAQRFGEHPEYGRYYRTGDVARWRETGVLDLFGRSDRQVKLRGNRIELGEIEATLLAHPEVGAAAVIMIGDPSADAVLIGCLEPADGSLDIESVWAHARAHLSRSMLPGDFFTMDALPVNGSGKVDYPALTRQVGERREHAAGARLDLDHPDLDDELTAQLTALWRTILKREDITADADFFECGGNSMLAAWAMQELQNMSGISLSLAEMFERPTPRGLAVHVRDTARRQPAAG